MSNLEKKEVAKSHRAFYKPFSKRVAKAEEEMEKIQIKDEPAGFDCEVCGSPMVIKLGRFGKFYACSNFPDCRRYPGHCQRNRRGVS